MKLNRLKTRNGEYDKDSEKCGYYDSKKKYSTSSE